MKLGVFGFVSQDMKECYCGERKFTSVSSNHDLAITKELMRSGRIVIDDCISVSRLRELFLDPIPRGYWIKQEIDRALRRFRDQGVTHLMLGSMMMERYLDYIMLRDLPVFSISNSVGYVLRGCKAMNVGVVCPGVALYSQSFHQNLLRQGIQVYLPANWGIFHPVDRLIRERQGYYPTADSKKRLLSDLNSLAKQPVSALIYGADNPVKLPTDDDIKAWPRNLQDLFWVNPGIMHIRYVYGLAFDYCP